MKPNVVIEARINLYPEYLEVLLGNSEYKQRVKLYSITRIEIDPNKIIGLKFEASGATSGGDRPSPQQIAYNSYHPDASCLCLCKPSL